MFCILLFCSLQTSHAAPERTILVMGDSLSAAFGIAKKDGWVALLKRRLTDTRIINASISGETTSGGRNRLPKLLLNHRPDIVIIELGANDGLRGLSLKAMKSNLEFMIKQSHAYQAKVLLVGIKLPPNYGPQYTHRFDAIFPELAAQHHVALVPFLFEGLKDNAIHFQADRIHPTKAAQPILLQNIWRKLELLQ